MKRREVERIGERHRGMMGRRAKIKQSVGRNDNRKGEKRRRKEDKRRGLRVCWSGLNVVLTLCHLC